MKELHLICESHIDPVWLWEWEEGASSAISTFQSAVNLASEFDYIFCHNEVTLYKFIEEYSPELFEKIRELVKTGKWHIMGGWYLQPDCNLPSGESFVRQAQTGKKYFKEKFGVEPGTAINFDSFGHTRGLVQIIKKCGQDSYLFVRPFSHQLELPDDYFLWKGFDGSTVKAFRSPTYNSCPFGNARNHITGILNGNALRDVWLCLWGVGNHGGGPSAKDLSDLDEMKKEYAGKTRIIHSTPEAFFSKTSPKEGKIFEKSLRTSMPGCYISNSMLKRRHIELEQSLYSAEMMMSAAALSGACEYAEKELEEACEDLLNAEFHDILPGTAIKSGERNGARFFEHGLQIANRVRAKAFFRLSGAEKQAGPGEYPILVFNVQPYGYETEVEVEFNLADQNYDTNIISTFELYDGDKKIPYQQIKEDANLNLDWRKRIIFRAYLPALSVKRFRLFMHNVKRENALVQPEGDFVFDNGVRKAVISRKTGLLTSYCVRGKEYLKGGAFAPFLYKDNEDPWGMSDWQQQGIGREPEPLPYGEKLTGVFEGREHFKVVEDGPIFTAVETFFQSAHTDVRLLYRIYKEGINVDVTATVIFADKNKVLKLHVPTAVSDGIYSGQTAFGTEELPSDGSEAVSHRFVTLGNKGDGDRLTIINNCTYGSAEKDGVIMIDLVRGALYSGHPIYGLPIAPERFASVIDMGEHEFSFRLTVAEEKQCERLANEFVRKPYALNIFPTGEGAKVRTDIISVSDKDVTVSAFKKRQTGEGYVLRLFNGCSSSNTCKVKILDSGLDASFGPYEVKTFVYDDKNGTIREEYEMLI